MILSRRVNPRASRMALMHASVPELVMRTFCTLGTSSQIIFAIVTSSGFGNAEARAVLGGGFDGGNDFWMRVAENRRPPSEDIINQFIPVHVPNLAAAGFVDKERMAADGAEGAHGRIDAAGNILQRLGEQGFRLGAIHVDKLTAKPPSRQAQELNFI